MADEALFDPGPPSSREGICSVCGEEHPIRKDGTVRAHAAPAKVPQETYCKGSREFPVAAPARGGEEDRNV